MKSPRFNFLQAAFLAGKYEIVSLLGRGWEGEVYKLRELATDIERMEAVLQRIEAAKSESR